MTNQQLQLKILKVVILLEIFTTNLYKTLFNTGVKPDSAKFSRLLDENEPGFKTVI